jgi:ElaB/YqjD/DUF883 family membrane-anchored ribosome-binding protein
MWLELAWMLHRSRVFEPEWNEDVSRCVAEGISQRTVAMATAKSVATEDMSDIQRRMAQIRRDLHEEVKGAVKGAQSLTDWRSQVKSHPWLALGAAAAVGYLIVPKRRRPETPTIVAVSPVAAAPVAGPSAMATPSSASRKGGSGILGSVFGLLAPIAVRAAQNYAIQYMEQWLAAQQGGIGPAPAPGFGAGPGTEPRPTAAGAGGPRPSAPSGGSRGRPPADGPTHR